MSTHLFRLKTEDQKQSLGLQAGLLKFLNADLIVYSLAAGLISFLVVILFIMCLDSFSFASFKLGLHAFLCFFNLNEKAKYLFSSLVLLYLSHEIILEFFCVLTFNSIQTNNVIADTSELIQNLDDVWSTKRVLCWMRGEIESFLVRNNLEMHILLRLLCLFPLQFSSQTAQKTR